MYVVDLHIVDNENIHKIAKTVLRLWDQTQTHKSYVEKKKAFLQAVPCGLYINKSSRTLGRVTEIIT